jgi:o-succinylbenzoate synthase
VPFSERANKMDFRLEFRRYSLPFRHSVRTSRGAWSTREGLYVRLERPDGSVGFGEAAPVPSFGADSIEGAETACQILGRNINEDVLARVPSQLGSLRNALVNALGTEKDVPLHKSINVAALLPSGRAALAEGPVKAEAGFRVFKWKVGVGAPDDEQAMLDDLIGALPDGSKLRLDANGAWNGRTASQWLSFASDRPIEFVEQPVAPDSKGAEDCLAGLAADFPVPVALDESIVNEGDVDRWLGRGWPGFYVIKPSLMGDVRNSCGKLASAGAKVVFSSALETAIGAQAALRMAFAWPGSVAALGFGVWPLFADPAFDGPAAAPYVRIEDVERIDPEVIWNAVR